jgi:hypothetical protein
MTAAQRRTNATATSPLAIYLNDHLAGSSLAIDLVGRLADQYADRPLGAFFRTLLTDIEADQRVLEGVMARCGAAQSPVKSPMARLLEKATRLKFDLVRGARDGLSLFERLEVLALGILGKQSLWRALQVIAPGDPRLADLDLVTLEARAAEQYARVEQRRLEAAALVTDDARHMTTKDMK